MSAPNRHPRSRKTCEWCKQPFTAGPKARFCCESCAGYARRRARGVPAKKGGWGQTPETKRELERYKKLGFSYQRAVRAWLADYKTDKGCADCGFDSHACALELDHEGVKTAEIAKIRTSVDRLKEEIRKGRCVVRCANCHAIKTHERRMENQQ